MKHKTPPVVAGQIAQRAPQCPLCGADVSLQATVDEFGQPSGWHFWGYQGERWIKCRGERGGVSFIHFMTLLNGAYSHRLAWIRNTVAESPPESPPEQQRLL